MPVRHVAGMAQRPAGPSGLRPGPAGLTAELVGLYKSRGEAFQTVFPTSPPPHARPHLHGHRLLKLPLLLASPPNQSLPNLDRVYIGWF
jgi:hypothetical protein